MSNEDFEPLEILLVIVVGALMVALPAKRRQEAIGRIEKAVGDPTVVPIHDGDALRLSAELRTLFERLLPGWLSPS